VVIGICTDSNSQLPAELRDRYGVEVVPLTISIDGDEYLEGVDLDPDAFWDRFAVPTRPEVATSQPSPGQFALAYEDLVGRGATEILSVHIGSALSGTVNSARLAAHNASVPVRLVDTGTASFGISCCVWAAADAIADGASIDEAAEVAESLIPKIGNVFVVGALDLVRAGGRVHVSVEDVLSDGIPVLTLEDGEIRVVTTVSTLDEAVRAMVDAVVALGGDLNAAVGLADHHGAPLSEALARELRAAPGVREVIGYRIGPSVGVHTGPGTAGAFVFPAATRAG
jgi:DegV family protein with EDD domain